MFLAGMISVLLVFGFVFSSCSQVFEGEDLQVGGTIKLTLKSSTYEVEHKNKLVKGNLTKTTVGIRDVYSFTSNGTGYAWVENNKVVAFFFSGGGLYLTALNMTKKSLINGETVISLDDIELIIEE